MSTYLDLDLWGGHNQFHIETNTFILNRQYGLFSNITVAMYGIAKLKTMGYDVQHIKFYLAEYENNYDFYPYLFKSNYTQPFLSIEDAYQFINTCHPTSHGLSRGWDTFVKSDAIKVQPILYTIYSTYFNTCDNINCIEDEIVNQYNINYYNSGFIWARKTDKTNETKIPKESTYLESIEAYPEIEKIYVQTDDISVVNTFENLQHPKICLLKTIPFSLNNQGFHERLYMIDNNDFITKYGCSKILYLQKIIALVNIASKCRYVTCYPGNLTTMIPMIRRSFDGCIFYLNAESIIL